MIESDKFLVCGGEHKGYYYSQSMIFSLNLGQRDLEVSSSLQEKDRELLKGDIFD